VPGSACRPLEPYAEASLFAYDDVSCSAIGTTVVDGVEYLGDSAVIIPPRQGKTVTRNDFYASIYCDLATNTLIVAYRGSTTPSARWTDADTQDWFKTNLLQRLGDPPEQYEYAYDLAYEVNERLDLGAFDNRCGNGRPKFLLTGHSKGGGEAQYAAILTRQKAIVFNSDAPNPLIFSERITDDHDGWFEQMIENVLRFFKSKALCGNPSQNAYSYTRYFQSGAIRDVRSVNDPLVSLFTTCRFPHAPFEWVLDRTSCSVSNGHSISALARELHLCATAGSP